MYIHVELSNGDMFIIWVSFDYDDDSGQTFVSDWDAVSLNGNIIPRDNSSYLNDGDIAAINAEIEAKCANVERRHGKR